VMCLRSSERFFMGPVLVPQEAVQRQAKKLTALESLHRVRPSARVGVAVASMTARK
jgi:hypothetical protein